MELRRVIVIVSVGCLVVAAGGILTNLLATRTQQVTGRAPGRDMTVQFTYRNTWLHPLRTAAIVEFDDPSTPGIRRWSELSGVDRDQALAEVMSTVDSDEVPISFRSQPIMALRGWVTRDAHP